MTNPIDLAARLGQINLSPSTPTLTITEGRKFHLLTFNFPAVSLLPPDSSPFLRPPANMGDRPPPHEKSCYTHMLGTKFFTTFEIPARRGSYQVESYEDDSCGQLLEAIDHLKTVPGKSGLRMVSFLIDEDNPSHGLIHRFELLTEGVRLPTLRYFELTDEQWGRLTMFADDEEWVEILCDLVTRGSERAVFEVEDALRDTWGFGADQSEISQLGVEWQTNPPPRSVEELFIAKLQPMSPADAEGLQGEGDRLLNLRLPCGHAVFIRKIHIVSLTAKACLAQMCQQCGMKILRSADRYEIQRRKECEALQSYRSDFRIWQDLDRNNSLSTVQLLVHSNSLVRALGISLVSFDMPRPVCPPSLCPTSFWETQLVMGAFERTYKDLDKIFHISSMELFDSLFNLAMRMICCNREKDVIGKASLSPNMEWFLTLWLTRAVKILVSGYEDSEESGEGLDDEESTMTDVEMKLENTRISDSGLGVL